MTVNKYNDPWEWVRLAVSSDRLRLPLTTVHVENDGCTAVATDGYRLHAVESGVPIFDGLTDGLKDPATRETVDAGSYPAWRAVMPNDRGYRLRVESDRLLPLLAGLARVKIAPIKGFPVVLPGLDDHRVTVNSRYLLDALLGMSLDAVIETGTKYRAVTLSSVSNGYGRRAVLMPIRPPATTLPYALPLDDFLAPAETTAEALAAAAHV